jgi:hypothetical protein
VRHALAGIDLGFGFGNCPGLDVGIDFVKNAFCLGHNILHHFPSVTPQSAKPEADYW